MNREIQAAEIGCFQISEVPRVPVFAGRTSFLTLRGDRASTVAVDSVVHYVLNRIQWLFQLKAEFDDDRIEQLKYGLEVYQKRIDKEVAVISDHAGMGTTVTMGYVA